MRLLQIKTKKKYLLTRYTVLALRTSNCISTQKVTLCILSTVQRQGVFRVSSKKWYFLKNCERTDSSKMKNILTFEWKYFLLKTRPRDDLKKIVTVVTGDRRGRGNRMEESGVLETSCVRRSSPGLQSPPLCGWTHGDIKGSRSFMSLCVSLLSDLTDEKYTSFQNPGFFSPSGNLHILIKTRHKAGMKKGKMMVMYCWWLGCYVTSKTGKPILTCERVLAGKKSMNGKQEQLD